jgi:type III restriction enzyme
MPCAKRKTRQELNEAYAFVTSLDFQATIESLRDGLVKNGFERQETKDLIHAQEEPAEDDLFSIVESLTFSPCELPAPDALPPGLQDKIEIAPEAGTITLKGHFTAKQQEGFMGIFQTEAGKDDARKALSRLEIPQKARHKSPSEGGEVLRMPLLAIRQGDLWEPFEDTHLLQGEWRLIDYPGELTEIEFKPTDRTAQGGRFYIKEERLRFEYFEGIETQLALFDFQPEWDLQNLLSWLERNIRDDSILPDEKAAFLLRAVIFLQETRGIGIKDLTYSKVRLRAALEEKIKAEKRQAMATMYRNLLIQPEQFASDGRCELIFQQDRYVYDWIYGGFTELPKHFFPQIGNLRSEGEEFDCAVFLSTQLEGVTYWIRNVERKPTSFSLQTSTDRLYPDFICRLDDGRILVVEYKNSRDWDLPDNQEKRILGELWERRSAGKGLFIMPKGKDWGAIRKKIAGN